MSNGIYEFNCGGIDSVAIMEVCTGGSTNCGACNPGGTTYSVPGVCHYGGDGTTNVYRKTTCNGTNSIVTCDINSNASCSSNDTDIWATNIHECAAFGQVNSFGGTITVNAQVELK